MRRKVSILAAAMMLFSIVFSHAYTNAKLVNIPKLQMVTQPKSEYYPGDRVSFTVTSPNYTGKVEYRVILYNGTTKKTSELWPSHPGYYYKAWQPAGNYKFTINWPVTGMEPGAYSLTVLVRRVGAKAAYDSYVNTSAFWVKAAVEGILDPRIVVEPNTGTTEKVIARVEARDGFKYEYKIGEGEWSAYIQPIEIRENVTLYVRSIDSSGNIAGETKADITNIKNNLPLSVTSQAFKNNEAIPVKYANTGVRDGLNTSIPLSWSNAPEGTKSFALIMYDLHPIADEWVHWSVVNIPANVNTIIEGASLTDKMPKGCTELNNTFGDKGYGGPEPPRGSGVHRYKVIIYALNTEKVDAVGSYSFWQFENLLKDNIISKAELIGTFER